MAHSTFLPANSSIRAHKPKFRICRTNESVLHPAVGLSVDPELGLWIASAVDVATNRRGKNCVQC